MEPQFQRSCRSSLKNCVGGRKPSFRVFCFLSLTMLESTSGKILEKLTTNTSSTDHQYIAGLDLLHQTRFHPIFLLPFFCLLWGFRTSWQGLVRAVRGKRVDAFWKCKRSFCTTAKSLIKHRACSSSLQQTCALLPFLARWNWTLLRRHGCALVEEALEERGGEVPLPEAGDDDNNLLSLVLGA